MADVDWTLFLYSAFYDFALGVGMDKVYVSPHGGGSDEHGEGSPENPCATLPRAFELVTDTRKDVVLMAGTHHVEDWDKRLGRKIDGPMPHSLRIPQPYTRVIHLTPCGGKKKGKTAKGKGGKGGRKR